MVTSNFLTIVDDHSWATWVYLLKTKNEVLTIFPGFINMVETQYKVKVKAVRSDNAPELRFAELYQSKRIVFFRSCPETPEQNSVVDRKHQHILNVARALMFQSQVPLIYWGGVFSQLCSSLIGHHLSFYTTKPLMNFLLVQLPITLKSERLDAYVMSLLLQNRGKNLKLGQELASSWDIPPVIRDINC